MATIVTLDEFASFLRVSTDSIVDRQILLDLAQGQIVDQVGVQTPWSATAKSIALTAAARAYYNPEGLMSASIDDGAFVYGDRGVYLTPDESRRLRGASGAGGPRYEFPAPDFTWATSTATTVSG